MLMIQLCLECSMRKYCPLFLGGWKTEGKGLFWLLLSQFAISTVCVSGGVGRSWKISYDIGVINDTWSAVYNIDCSR